MKDERKNVSMEIKSHNAFLLAVIMLFKYHVQYCAFDKRKGLEGIDRIMSMGEEEQSCFVVILKNTKTQYCHFMNTNIILF